MKGQRYTGQRLKRFEDLRVLHGATKYVDDIHLPGMLYMAVIRSPVAHAQLRAVNLPSKTERRIVSFISGEEASKLAGPIPNIWKPPGMKIFSILPLAVRKLRYVGEPTAALVAEDRYSAHDMAEFADLEYDALPPVVSAERALESDSPLLYDEWGTNVCYERRIVNGDVESAFTKAHLIVKERFRIQRQHGSALEPRGVVASYDRASQQLTVWSSTQFPHVLRTLLSECLMIPEHTLRVIAPDVGGGFGNKIDIYPEEVLACIFAIRTGRPIKWVASRREDFLATVHSREQIHDVELALDQEGYILGLKDTILADVGVLHTSNVGPPIVTLASLPGPYKIRNCDLRLHCVVTNKTPIGAYRGYGQPQALFVIERAIDIAAGQLGLDPAEIRERNLPTSKEFPFRTLTNQMYDSGDYRSALRKALEEIEYNKLREEQKRLRGRGEYLGIGISFCLESAGWGPSPLQSNIRYKGYESVTVRVEPSGAITVLTGLSPHGQGTATALAQLCADALSIPITDISIIHGDTATCPFGNGTWGSRSAAVGGVALTMSVEKIKQKAIEVAAHMLEARAEDIVYAEGAFHVKDSPNKLVTLKQVAEEAYSAKSLPKGIEPGLEATSSYDPSGLTYPYGVHIAAVQADPGTGQIKIVRYLVVEDCGVVINPAIVDGQLHGGVAQGIGGAIFEDIPYDDEGQPLATSYIDYLIPTSLEIPEIEVGHTETPSPVNPLGIKGVGESGIIPPPAAIANAVEDALRLLGVRIRETPLSPEKLWKQIHSSNSS